MNKQEFKQVMADEFGFTGSGLGTGSIVGRINGIQLRIHDRLLDKLLNTEGLVGIKNLYMRIKDSSYRGSGLDA